MKYVSLVLVSLFVYLTFSFTQAQAQGMPVELRPKFTMQHCDVSSVTKKPFCLEWEYFTDEIELVVGDSIYKNLPKRVDELSAVRRAVSEGVAEEYESYSERFIRDLRLNFEDAKSIHQAGFDNIVRMRFKNVDNEQKMGRWLAIFAQDYNVKGIYFSSVVKIIEYANDPLLIEQWHIFKYKFDEAQKSDGFGSPEIITSLFDTGYYAEHPDLPKPTGSFDHVTGLENVTQDRNGHGTAVAGIALQIPNNGIGGVGTSPNVSFWVRKVISDSGNGEWGVLANAIIAQTKVCKDARKENPNIRCTFSFSIAGIGPIPSIDAALDFAYKEGIVAVAAAGNWPVSLDRVPVYPAAKKGTIPVAGLDRNDNLTTFSGYGTGVPMVAAGAISIITTVPKDSIYFKSPTGYIALHGTSAAAPQVMGAINLAWSKYRDLTPSQIIIRTLGSSDPIETLKPYIASGGRLNVALMMDFSNEIPETPEFSISNITHTSIKTTHIPKGQVIGFVNYISEEPFDETTFEDKNVRTVWTILASNRGDVIKKIVDYLPETTTQYIAVKVFDRGGNLSPLSSVLEFTTKKSMLYTERTFTSETGEADPGQWFADEGPLAQALKDAGWQNPVPWHLSSTIPTSSEITKFNWRCGKIGALDYFVGGFDAVVESETFDLRGFSGASLTFDYFQNISPLILGDNFELYAVPLDPLSNRKLDSILLKEFGFLNNSSRLEMTEKFVDLSVVAGTKFKLVFRVVSRSGGLLGGLGWTFGNVKIFVDEQTYLY